MAEPLTFDDLAQRRAPAQAPATPGPPTGATAPRAETQAKPPLSFDDLDRIRRGDQPRTARPAPTLTPPATTAEAPAPARTLGEGFLKPFEHFIPAQKRIASEAFDSMSEEWKNFWKHDTLLGNAFGVLKGMGDAINWVTSPVQAGIESFAGTPFEAATGVKGSAQKIGEWGSFAAQLAGLDPLAATGKALGAVRESAPGRFVEETFSPQSVLTKIPRMVSDPANPGKLIPLRTSQGARFSPQGLGKIVEDKVSQAGPAGRLIIKNLGQMNLSGAQARNSLEQFRGVVAKLSPDERLEFNLHMAGEGTGPLATGLQPLAKELRRLIDEREQRLVDIGALKHASRDYWPRLFKNPELAEAEFDRYSAAVHAKRPLRGARGKAGLATRTVPTLKESLDKGLELITDNPIDMAILRMDGMDKWYYGTKIGQELKAQPYMKFYRWYKEHEAGGQGLVKMDDRFFEARLPPATFAHKFEAKAIHEEVFDPEIRKGIQDVARFLGADLSKPLRSVDPYLASKPGVLGYAQRGTKKTVSVFGGGDEVLMHEIGHQLDWHYGLSAIFARNPVAWKELEDLALYRSTASKAVLAAQDPDFLRYLLEPEERMANMFHAYWHTPDMLKHVAPAAFQQLNGWLALPANRALKGVIDSVKPSVQMASDLRLQKFEDSVEKYFPGIRYLGSWYAPEPVANLFNNYVNPTRVPKGLYDTMRRTGTFLNNLQLGLSAFHMGMVSIDASVSSFARLLSLDTWKSPKKLADIGVSILPIVGPVYSGISRPFRGRQLRQALLNEADPLRLTPDFQKFMKAFELSGGRVNMDMIHRSTGMGSLFKAFRGGYLQESMKNMFAQVKTQTPGLRQAKIALVGAERLLDEAMEPIMGSFVPNVKIGVFHDMMKDWIESHPHATEEEFGIAAQSRWDSVDNRMGQLVYDNLFWSQTLKTAAFIGIRAVGWNLGTEREIGGGISDAIRSTGRVLTGTGPLEITERTKYTIALPIVVAIQGGMLNYLYTGEMPRELLDYFYPRNGRTTPDGAAERVSMPSYVKDVFSYYYDPMGTAFNKMHPLFELGKELIAGKDYYGDPIVSKADPTSGAVQALDYALRTATPFSIRGWRRQAKEGADLFPQIMSEFGFVPAPVSITNPKKTEAFEQLQDIKGFRRREKRRLSGQ